MISWWIPEKWGYSIHITNEHGYLTNPKGEKESSGGLVPGGEDSHGLQEGDDAVLGDGLEETGGSCERLKTSTKGWKKRSNFNHFWMRECDIANNHTATNTVAVPEWKHER